MHTTDFHHILVVDDDTRLNALLKKFLSNQGFVVTTAASVAEAQELCTLFQFDLWILDVMMPVTTGIEFLQQARQTDNTPVIMLTALGETDNRIKGLEAGADDYVAKPFEPKELLLRIKAILKRAGVEEGAKPLGLTFGDYHFTPATLSLSYQNIPVSLTSSEQQLLAMLAQSPNTVFSREDIAEKLGLAATEGRAVDVQITRLRKKSPDLARFLQTVRGQGYVLRV